MKKFYNNCIDVKQRGSTLLYGLIALATLSSMYTFSSINISNANKAEKLIMTKVTWADLQLKMNAICSNIHTINNSAKYNNANEKNKINACTNKSGDCLAQGFEASLFNEDGSQRYTGTRDCPALYNYYGSVITENTNKDKCITLDSDLRVNSIPGDNFFKEATFAVVSKLKPTCRGNLASCKAPETINVECSVVEIDRAQSNQEKYVTSEANDIAGFVCPPDQIVRGISKSGVFHCELPEATHGPRGPKGQKGGKGGNGSNGADGGSYSYSRDTGCFAKGTKIMTKLGSKNVEEIMPFDQIWNPVNFNFQTVKKRVIGPEKNPMLKIYLGNYFVEVTELHPFEVEGIIKKAKELRAGDLIMTQSGLKSIQKIDSIIHSELPTVYNLFLNGSNHLNDHFILANSIVTGDLYMQQQLELIRPSKGLNQHKGLAYAETR